MTENDCPLWVETRQFCNWLTQPGPGNGNVSLHFRAGRGEGVSGFQVSGRCLETISLATCTNKKRLEMNPIFLFVFQNKMLQKENAELKKKLTAQTNWSILHLLCFFLMFNPATVPGISHDIFYSVTAVSHWPNSFLFLTLFVWF